MIDIVADLAACEGFEWDEGNFHKSWKKHRVSYEECEEVFVNDPLLLFDDLKHSDSEERYYALGRNNANRRLYVTFTFRGNLIRVISARDMVKSERTRYETQT